MTMGGIPYYLSLLKPGESLVQNIEAVKIEGGVLTKMLRNLERSNFILGYQHFGHKTKDVIYRLVDFYTLFYYHFIEGDRSQDEQWWLHHFQLPVVNDWQGFSFELICLLHLRQIKQALGISGMATEASAWRIAEDKHLRHHLRCSQSRGPQHLTKPSADGRPVWKLMF